MKFPSSLLVGFAAVYFLGPSGQWIKPGAGLQLSKVNEEVWKMDVLTPYTKYNSRFTEGLLERQYHSEVPMMTETLRLYVDHERQFPAVDYVVIDTRTVEFLVAPAPFSVVYGDYLPAGSVDPTQ